MSFEITHRITGDVVTPGDTVTDFRGQTATLLAAERANEQGRDGKVSVRDSRGFSMTYYARVFDLSVAAVA